MISEEELLSLQEGDVICIAKRYQRQNSSNFEQYNHFIVEKVERKYHHTIPVAFVKPGTRAVTYLLQEEISHIVKRKKQHWSKVFLNG